MPLDVVFIGGYGRSGSTLLQRLLARVDGVVAAGEVRHIWERGYLDDERCGCGDRFSACPFWSAVTTRAYGTLTRDEAAAIFALKRSVERPRRTHQIRFGLAGPAYRRRLRRYTGILGRLYAAIRDVSGADVVVDASKDPTHGFVLARMPGLTVHTVHLVRDSRASAHSWQRERVRPEIHWERQFMPVRGALDAAVRWTAANALTELMRGHGAGYVRLRYEDLAEDPREGMRRTLASIGRENAPMGFLRDGRAELGRDHTVSGNPLRFATGSVDIRPDLAWQGELRALDRVVVTAVSAPLLVRYGYRFRRPGTTP